MWICEYTHTFKTVGLFSFTETFQNVSGSSFLLFIHLIWTFQQHFLLFKKRSLYSVNFYDLSHTSAISFIIAYGFAAVIIHLCVCNY